MKRKNKWNIYAVQPENYEVYINYLVAYVNVLLVIVVHEEKKVEKHWSAWFEQTLDLNFISSVLMGRRRSM